MHKVARHVVVIFMSALHKLLNKEHQARDGYVGLHLVHTLNAICGFRE